MPEHQPAGPDFDALFHQHWERVCTVLYRLVGDWAEAEDLALDVFLQLYRQPPQGEGSLAGWLYRVATRLGFNALRARRRRQQYETRAGRWMWETQGSPDPQEALEQAQQRQQVRAVLAAMPPRSAQVLLLRYSGLSYAEIAASLGMAPGSVGTLLARAEREFEERFSRYE